MTFDILPSLVIWVIFMVFGGYAATAILYVVYESELLEQLRAYIEARYPRSKLNYLINCPFCLSYWISLFVTLLFTLLCIIFPLFYFDKMIILIMSIFTYLSIAGQQVTSIKASAVK